MAVSIGPKIGIDGEKQYRDEINKIIQQAKTLDAEMKSVTSSFDADTTAKQKSTAMSKVLNSQIETQTKRVEALSDMVEKSAKATGEDSTQTLKWKEALANAQADLNNTKSRLENLDDEIAKSGKEMDNGSGKAKIFGAALMANLASKAIVAGVKALGSAIKGVGQAIGSCVTDSAQFADNVLTLSTNTGLSTDQIQEFQYMAELTDTSLETVTGSLTKLTKNMATAQGGTGAAAEAFAKLGVDVTDAEGNLRSNQDVFMEVIDSLGQMDNATERDATSMALFGKSAQDLNSLISIGSEGIAGFAEEAHNMGYVLDGDALSSLGAVDDAMQRLKNTGTTLKNQVGLALAPALGSLSDELMGVFGKLDFSNGLTGLIDSVLAALPGALSAIMEHASELIAVITPIIPELVTGLIEAITTNAPMLIAGAVQLIVALGDGLVQSIPLLLASIPAVVMAILNGFATGLAPMLDTGKQAISDMWAGISESAAMLWEQLTAFVQNNIIAPVSAKVDEFRQIGTYFVKGLWAGISSSFEWIRGKLAGWVGSVLDYLKKLFGISSPSKVTAGYGRYLVEGLAKGIDDNIALATNAWDNVASAVGMSVNAPGATAGGASVINIYPQQMDNATVDYLFERFNARMGALA